MLSLVKLYIFFISELFPKGRASKRKRSIQDGPVPKKAKTSFINPKTKSFNKQDRRTSTVEKKGHKFKQTKKDNQMKNFGRRTKPMNKANKQPKRAFKTQAKKHSKSRGRK